MMITTDDVPCFAIFFSQVTDVHGLLGDVSRFVESSLHGLKRIRNRHALQSHQASDYFVMFIEVVSLNT